MTTATSASSCPSGLAATSSSPRTQAPTSTPSSSSRRDELGVGLRVRRRRSSRRLTCLRSRMTDDEEGQLIIVFNLVVDLLYAWIDPRIQTSGAAARRVFKAARGEKIFI